MAIRSSILPFQLFFYLFSFLFFSSFLTLNVSFVQLEQAREWRRPREAFVFEASEALKLRSLNRRTIFASESTMNPFCKCHHDSLFFFRFFFSLLFFFLSFLNHQLVIFFFVFSFLCVVLRALEKAGKNLHKPDRFLWRTEAHQSLRDLVSLADVIKL